MPYCSDAMQRNIRLGQGHAPISHLALYFIPPDIASSFTRAYHP